MAISDWPAEERPRERLLKYGAGVLSDAELLAIFLRVGLPGKTAVDLARELLQQLGGDLSRLGSASPASLSQLPGLVPAKAAQLLASLELSRRALSATLLDRDVLPRRKSFAIGSACA